ncbi:MAG: DUF4190 domain-containing protein, partial [Bacteroidia bacterium]
KSILNFGLISVNLKKRFFMTVNLNFILLSTIILFSCKSSKNIHTHSDLAISQLHQDKNEINPSTEIRTITINKIENSLNSNAIKAVLPKNSRLKEKGVIKSPNQIKFVENSKLQEKKETKEEKSFNRLAFFSFLVGLISYGFLWIGLFLPAFYVIGLIGFIVGGILGIRALRQIKNTSERGKGFAIIAIILGTIPIFLLLVYITLNF